MPARIPLIHGGQVPLRQTGDYTARTPKLSAGDTGLGDALGAVGKLASTVGRGLASQAKKQDTAPPAESPSAQDVTSLLEGESAMNASAERFAQYQKENPDPEQWTGRFDEERKLVQQQMTALNQRLSPQGQKSLQSAYQAYEGRHIRSIGTQTLERRQQMAEQAVISRSQQAVQSGDKPGFFAAIRLGRSAGVLPEEKAAQVEAEGQQMFHQQGVAQVDREINALREKRDVQGGLKVIGEAKKDGRLNAVEYQEREKQIHYLADVHHFEGLAETDPLSLLKMRPPGNRDARFARLKPGDQDLLMKRAQTSVYRLGDQEIQAARQAVDDLDLEALRQVRGVERVALKDLGLPPMKHADTGMQQALDHYLAVKQGGGTLDRPGLFQWARTQMRNYEPEKDRDGTVLQQLRTWTGLSFGENEAAQLQADLDAQMKEPNPLLGMAFDHIDRRVFGTNQMGWFALRENQGPGGGSGRGFTSFFSRRMPDSLESRAADADLIKRTLEQAVIRGEVKDGAQMQAMADRLLAEKKNTNAVIPLQTFPVRKGDRVVDMPALPGFVFDPATGKQMSKYSLLHHEAWNTRASDLYGAALKGDVLDRNLLEIVNAGYAQGWSHVKTAGVIREWRNQMQGKAAAALGEAETQQYFTGTHHLNELTGTMLRELRNDAVQDWGIRTFGQGTRDYEDFFASYEANGGSPEAMGGFQKQAEELKALEDHPVWRVAKTQGTWLPLHDDNGTEVATFQPLMRGDQMDVQVDYRDVNEETGITRVSISPVTPAELEKMAQEADARAKNAADNIAYLDRPYTPDRPYTGGFGFDPYGMQAMQEANKRNEYVRMQETETKRAKLLRSPDGRLAVTTERVMEAVKKSPAGERLGHSDLSGDFLRGLAGFYAGSRVAWNDLSGDETEREEWRNHLANLRQYLPGSTGAQAGVMSKVAEGAGGMTPQVLASLTTGGAGLLSSGVRTALMQGGGMITTTTLGSLGISSYGNAVHDALSRADVLEKEGTPESLAKAESIRRNYRYIAGGLAVTEMAVEKLLPEELLLLGKGKGGFVRNFGNNMAKGYAEGYLGSLGQQTIEGFVYGDPVDLGEAHEGGWLEMLVGSPLSAVGAIPRGQPAGAGTDIPGMEPGPDTDADVTGGADALLNGTGSAIPDPDADTGVAPALTDDSRFAPPAPDAGAPLSPASVPPAAQQAAQERANQEWNNDPQGLVDDYLESNGVFVSGDEAKELFTPYRDNPQDNSAAVHGAAMKVADAAWDRLIARPPEKGVVVLAGGGPGAGKSTVLGGKDSWRDRADAVWDGTLAWYPSTKAMVQKSLDSGRQVLIQFVHRPFDQAWEGIMDRAVKTGRTLPLQVAAEKHAQALDAIRQLQEDFGNQIEIQVFRNAKGVGEHEQITLEELNSEIYDSKHDTAAQADIRRASGAGPEDGRSKLPEGQGSDGTWRDLAARWNDSGLHRAEAAARAGRISPGLYRALTGSDLAPDSAAHGTAADGPVADTASPDHSSSYDAAPTSTPVQQAASLGTAQGAAGGRTGPVAESSRRRLRGAVDRLRIAFARLGTPITEARDEAEAQRLGLTSSYLGVGPNGLVFAPHRLPDHFTDRVADAAVQEELIHVAWVHALHQLWQQQGPGRAADFQAFMAAQTRQLMTELDGTAAGRQAFLNAANVYANPRARSRGRYRSYQEARDAYQGQESYLFAELGRQLIQLRRQGDMTESAFRRAMGYIQKWFKTALDGLRAVAADPAAVSPALNDAIRETEAVLNSAGQGGRKALPPAQFQYTSSLDGPDEGGSATASGTAAHTPAAGAVATSAGTNPHGQDTANDAPPPPSPPRPPRVRPPIVRDPQYGTPRPITGSKPVEPPLNRFSPEGQQLTDAEIEQEADAMWNHGHAVDRHGPEVTDGQLELRALEKIDPITMTRQDGTRPGDHSASRHATQFTSLRAIALAKRVVENSATYRDKLAKASHEMAPGFTVDDLLLETAFGPSYLDHVRGKTKVNGSSPPQAADANLTDGHLLAFYKRDPATGKYKLHTLYPDLHPHIKTL